MSSDSIAQISITLGTPVIDTASFGTPIILSSEANGKFSGFAKRYASASELLTDGFSPTGATYRFASKIKGQNPAPAEFMIGKRVESGDLLVDYDFTIEDGLEADVYELSINGSSFSYIRPDGYTNDQVASELESLISVSNFSTSVAANKITLIGSVDGDFPLITKSDNISFTDNTTNTPGKLTEDLSNIFEYDNSFYGVLLDSNTAADIKEAAEWCENNRRILFYENSDSACVSMGSTSDIFSELEVLSYANTCGIFSKSVINEGKAAAWLGLGITYDPGTFNFAHKTLRGVTYDKLSRSEESTLESKSGNYYGVVAGRGNTFSGITPSGEFIDTASVIHLLYARIQEAVISALKSSPKIPYTNAGVNQIVSVIQGVLFSQVGRGLTDDPEPPRVTAPNVQSININLRQARIVPDIKFIALLSGAINQVQVSGILTLDSSVFTG